jgi:alpha-beta hydrolase superfamily lysophospholipase
MENLHLFSFPSSDGVHRCRAFEWRTPEQPRAVVQIVHGISEHMGRYDHVARFLREHGILVCGEDHLGHGQTAQMGEYGYFAQHDGWTLVTADVRRLRQIQGEKYPGVPYFLLGHSMGSFLTRTYLCRYPGEVDGAILSGTGQESAPLVALGKGIASLLCAVKGGNRTSGLVNRLSLGAYNQKFKPNRTSADWISRDEAAVDAYLADPLCSFQPTVGMFRDMMGGLQYIASPSALSQMDPATPVYLMSGDQDPVGGMGKGVKKVYGFFQKYGTRDLELKLYPGGRHEMFNELNRQEVLEDLLAWLDRHIAG